MPTSARTLYTFALIIAQLILAKCADVSSLYTPYSWAILRSTSKTTHWAMQTFIFCLMFTMHECVYLHKTIGVSHLIYSYFELHRLKNISYKYFINWNHVFNRFKRYCFPNSKLSLEQRKQLKCQSVCVNWNFLIKFKSKENTKSVPAIASG